MPKLAANASSYVQELDDDDDDDEDAAKRAAAAEAEAAAAAAAQADVIPGALPEKQELMQWTVAALRFQLSRMHEEGPRVALPVPEEGAPKREAAEAYWAALEACAWEFDEARRRWLMLPKDLDAERTTRAWVAPARPSPRRDAAAVAAAERRAVLRRGQRARRASCPRSAAPSCSRR